MRSDKTVDVIPDGAYVYVAGPYTQGDPEENTRAAMDAAHKILDAGHFPFVPHLSHFMHAHRARPYEEWLNLDFAWLYWCDILLRLPGYSPGAEREVAVAMDNDIEIAYSVERAIELAGKL